LINVCNYEIKEYYINQWVFLILVPLLRKNRNDDIKDEKKIKTFERQKQCLGKIADINELRKHLKAVRTHIDEVKQHQQTPISSNENENRIQ
jgi:hypothetical protein